MTKIKNTGVYIKETEPTLSDFLVGTKDSNGKTKSFSLEAILRLLNSSNGVNNIQFKFSNGSHPTIDFLSAGYFFTDTNTTEVGTFTQLIFNKETLQPLDVSQLFSKLGELEDVVIKLENPEDPNNFFNFNIISFTDNTEYFTFGIEVYNDLYLGELINNHIYSFYFDIKSVGSVVDISGKEDKNNKQNSLHPDGTGEKYPTIDVLKSLTVSNGLSTNLDAVTVKDGNDLGYIKIGQVSLALNTAVTLDNFISTNMKKYQNKFKLYAGRKYKLTAKLRTSFSTNTSFNRLCFYDETRGVYIDTSYPYKGGGTTNIEYGTDFTGNNPTIDTVTAVLYPEQNIFVSLKMVQLTGTITGLDSSRTYSCITIEEVGTENIEVLVSINTLFGAHMQGMVYTTDYPTVIFASLTDRIVKIDLATGNILQTLSYTSHVGGICYFNGKIYAGYTLLADFNNASPTSRVLEIDPVTTTLIRAVNNTGVFAFGAIGTNGTDMYVGYGSTLISNGRIQKIDPVTLLLTGSVIIVANVGNEFGNGIQTINYFNGLWYLGTHLGGLVTDPLGFNGGGLVTMNNSFVVQNIYKRNSGDWADGWGNGFIQYKGKIYWSEPNSLEAPFTHRIRELVI